MGACEYGFCTIIHVITQHLGHNKVNSMVLSRMAMDLSVIKLLLKASARHLESLSKEIIEVPRYVVERNIIEISNRLKFIASHVNPQQESDKAK